MKFQYVSLFLAGLSTVVAQGSFSDLPQCAKECGTGSTPDHCQSFDAKCACEDKPFLMGVACCLSEKCSVGQTQDVIKFTKKLCSGVGVNDLPEQPTCSSSGNSTAAASSSSSSSSSSALPTSSETATGGAGLVHAKDASFIAAVGAAAFAFLA